MAFYRVLFFAESPDTKIDDHITEYSAFAVPVASARVVDITKTMDRRLRDLVDYSACQDFADVARAASADGIRARSVRCPKGGQTLSWLTCRVFTDNEPSAHQSWRMRLSRPGVQAFCENPHLCLEFEASAFSTDPRVKGFDWTRVA